MITPNVPSVARSFTLTNGSTSPSSNVSLAISGANATAFSLANDTCGGQLLAGGANCTVEVIFNPTTTGVALATLTATADGTQATLSLRGTGAVGAMLSLAPTLQDFGPVVQGMSSADVTFTVTNRGDLTSGSLSATIGGAGSSQFVIASDACL